MSNIATPKITRAYSATVITVSDSSFAGQRDDLSGPAVAAALQSAGIPAGSVVIVPDEVAEIQTAILRACDSSSLIVTTGGTGISERDVTPEATRAICDRLIEGIPEHMRREGAKQTPRAVLSRAACGSRGQCLILNLPGSPRGAVDALSSVLPLLEHMLDLLAGDTAHAAPGDSQ